jgi:signal peptidase I
MSLKILDEEEREAANAGLVLDRISEPEKWRLFEDILGSGSALRVKVTGMSMIPFLRGGEILTLRKVDGSSLKRGDLNLFRNKAGYSILHRVVRITRRKSGPPAFQTKGDALIASDDPVLENEILGKVCKIVKGTRCINMETRIQSRLNYLIAVAGLLKSRFSSALHRFKNLV